MKKYRIATIQGDGIGKEVVPEGMRVLDAVGKKAGIQLGLGTISMELCLPQGNRPDDAGEWPRADPPS